MNGNCGNKDAGQSHRTPAWRAPPGRAVEQGERRPRWRFLQGSTRSAAYKFSRDIREPGEIFAVKSIRNLDLKEGRGLSNILTSLLHG